MSALSQEKAVERLTKYYETQVEEFPRMSKDIPLELFIRRNVVHVRKNNLLCRFDSEHKAWCRYGFGCHEV